MASRSRGPAYSVAQLSDGERNALLIAANVLTSPAGSLVLIDEPERHLHRSIISNLLTELFAKRQDCAFVVSTHDLMLPLDNSSARTLLLRGCEFDGEAAVRWDVDLLPSAEQIDDDVKTDILGARRKMVFAEGSETSLDKPLYALIFPGVTVVPKSNCREVERAVTGIRGATDLVWLTAFGIIDNDGRPPAELEALRNREVHALPTYSVEGVYYHPDVQRRVAVRHAEAVGGKAPESLEAATSAALDAIAAKVEHLSRRVAEQIARARHLATVPTREDIEQGKHFRMEIDLAAIVAGEQTALKALLEARNLGGVVERYPVRETAALDKIAKALGFQSRQQYEQAVRKLLADDAEALAAVRAQFGDLPAQLGVT